MTATAAVPHATTV